MSLSKKQAQRIHAARRARERYGLDVTKAVRRELVDRIQGGKSNPVKRYSCRITVHDLEYRGRLMRLIFDSRRHEIVTFLPEDAVLPPGRRDVTLGLEDIAQYFAAVATTNDGVSA